MVDNINHLAGHCATPAAVFPVGQREARSSEIAAIPLLVLSIFGARPSARA